MCFGIGLALHRDAHGTGLAFDDAARRFERGRVEVRHLLLGDLLDLGAANLADLALVRRAGALLDPRGLLDQHAGRGRLDLQVEGPVVVDRDHAPDDLALELGRRGVELLDELAGVDALGAEHGTQGRGRRGLAARGHDLELVDDFFLGHVFLPPTVAPGRQSPASPPRPLERAAWWCLRSWMYPRMNRGEGKYWRPRGGGQ